MSDTTEDLPNPKIIVALVNERQRVGAERKQIGMELQDRLNHHKENSNLKKWTVDWMVKLDRMDEQEREDAIRHVNHAIQAMRSEKWDRESHVGDLADMAEAEPLIPAQQATPTNAMPLDEAEKVFQRNAHKAPKPANPDDDDKDVRPRHLIENEKQREAGGEPDLPAAPKRKRKAALEGAEGTGTYKIH